MDQFLWNSLHLPSEKVSKVVYDIFGSFASFPFIWAACTDACKYILGDCVWKSWVLLVCLSVFY